MTCHSPLVSPQSTPTDLGTVTTHSLGPLAGSCLPFSLLFTPMFSKRIIPREKKGFPTLTLESAPHRTSKEHDVAALLYLGGMQCESYFLSAYSVIGALRDTEVATK